MMGEGALERRWNEFTLTLPRSLPPKVLNLFRYAFYAGAMCFQRELASGTPAESLDREIRAFQDELKRKAHSGGDPD
jgi:hypothetical protein